MSINRLKAVIIAAPLLLASAPAFAGAWVVDLGQCPDHLEDILDRREDVRDARVDNGRQDRREDRQDRRENRRDEARTVCPASSLVFDRRARGRDDARHRSNGRVVLVKQRDRRGNWGLFEQGRGGRLTPARVIEASERDIRAFARTHPRAGQDENRRNGGARDNAPRRGETPPRRNR